VIVVVAGVANASRVSSAVEVSSVFVPALAAEYGWSRTLIASATTVGGIATSLTGPIVGRILDRFGARLVVPFGALVVGVGCFTLANVQTAALFVAVYAMVRMGGQSFMQFPNQVTVANWFDRRRGAATALLVGVGSIGLIVAPVVVQAILTRSGIAAAWIFLGVIVLVLGFAPTLLLTARRPEDIGLRPDGAEAPAADEAGTPADASAADWTLHEALSTSTLWLVLASGIMFSLASTGVGFHELSYFQEQGIAPGTTAAVVSTFAFGLTAGGVAWGWLADRIRVQWLIMTQYALGSVLTAWLTTIDVAPFAFVFSFSFGVLVGGGLALPTLLLARYYGRTNLGAIAGVLQMTRGLSLGSGPLVAGLFYDATGAYYGAFVTFSIMGLVSAALMTMARQPDRRPGVLM